MRILTTKAQRHKESQNWAMTDAPTHPTLADALQAVAGCVLSSVTFVADYVQFDFNGPGLTAYILPVVTMGSESLRWGEFGYRDALCLQIGRHVERVEADETHVAIIFEGGSAISISLLDKDYRGPEALQFSLNQDRMWVV
jgi:hypothetical protein